MSTTNKARTLQVIGLALFIGYIIMAIPSIAFYYQFPGLGRMDRIGIDIAFVAYNTIVLTLPQYVYYLFGGVGFGFVGLLAGVWMWEKGGKMLKHAQLQPPENQSEIHAAAYATRSSPCHYGR